MENQNRISYNAIAEAWDDYRKQSPMNRCIVEFANLLPEHAKILDIGCGSGSPIDEYLARAGFEVLGMDIAENMIQKANRLQLQNVRFLVCDFLEFQTDEKFDAVIAFDSLWHVEESEQPQIYPKVASLLKPNGYFLFTHGLRRETITGEMFANTFLYSALDKDELQEILRRQGFEILQWTENYQERTTGTRDLFVVAQKQR